VFHPDASAGARQALSVVNNRRGAEMGLFASSPIALRIFSLFARPWAYVLCNRLTHCLGRLSRILDVTGIQEKKIELAHAGRLGQDDEVLRIS